MTRTLLIGYGNPGRLDDGLGPACAQAVETLSLPGVTVETNYQLNVEDAALLAGCDVVVFADASVSGDGPFELRPVAPAEELSFSTHSVGPGALVALARDLYRATPRAFTLAIRGYEFNEFEERLSERATSNLDAAVEFIARAIRHDRLEAGAEIQAGPGPTGPEPNGRTET